MIRVPLLNQESENKFVEVQQSRLPADVTQIISFLSQEKASIEYWLEISVSQFYLPLTLVIVLADVLSRRIDGKFLAAAGRGAA